MGKRGAADEAVLLERVTTKVSTDGRNVRRKCGKIDARTEEELEILDDDA